MKKQISYPKIQQFRNVISTIRRQSTFVGLDENEEAIYDNTKKLPVLEFTGTVKLHGTNAAVCYNEIEGIWFQSRTRIITPESDNAGFAFFANSAEDTFNSMFYFLADLHDIDLKKNTISIYGEWAGERIQKGVAISEIGRAFYIFGVKVSPFDEEIDSYWLDVEKAGLEKGEENIYDINSFETYKLDIDFNYPELAQEQLVKITNAVEECCPVAKQLGKEGIGEGVVWTTKFNGTVHRFKVKGEKHSTSKVKTLAPVDAEKVANIREFIDYAVTKNRLEQGVKEVFGENEPDIKLLGKLISWVIKDVNSEESDVMVKNNLYPKDVNKYIAPKVKEYFMQLI